jgi:hypothetical protein
LKSDLTRDAKVQQVGIVQLQSYLIMIVNFLKVVIEELPLDLTRDVKVQKNNI